MIGKPHVLEFDGSLKLSRHAGLWIILDRRRSIEQGKDPLRWRHGRLHDVVLLGQIADRLIHTLNILDEGDDDAGLDRLLQNQSSPVPEEQTEGQRAKDLDDRKKHRVVLHAAQQDIAIAVIDVLEAVVHLRLLAESLNSSDSGDVLL